MIHMTQRKRQMYMGNLLNLNVVLLLHGSYGPRNMVVFSFVSGIDVMFWWCTCRPASLLSSYNCRWRFCESTGRYFHKLILPSDGTNCHYGCTDLMVDVQGATCPKTPSNQYSNVWTGHTVCVIWGHLALSRTCPGHSQLSFINYLLFWLKNSFSSQQSFKQSSLAIMKKETKFKICVYTVGLGTSNIL